MKPDTALYFTIVVAIAPDRAVFGGHLCIEETEPTLTRFDMYDAGEWRNLGDFDEVSYAAELKQRPTKTRDAIVGILGRTGLYRERSLARGSKYAEARLDTTDAGYLNDLRYIGTHLYACGGQRQVHRQAGRQWTKIDQGAFVPLDDGQEHISFEAIDGFSDDDIYAVGWAGELWHWNGRRWTQLESPTNYPLYSVKCTSTREVYIGGSNGLVFKGDRRRGWADLSDSGLTTEVVEDIAEFKGHVYFAVTEKLLRTNGARLEEVKVPIRGDKAFYALDSVDEELWSVGDECILQYDGKKWKKHVDPNNA